MKAQIVRTFLVWFSGFCGALATALYATGEGTNWDVFGMVTASFVLIVLSHMLNGTESDQRSRL